MTTLVNLKLNTIYAELNQVANNTPNQEIINAVIAYINNNLDKIEPAVDITKLNLFVEKYLQDNRVLFQGQQGIAGQSPVLDYSVLNSTATKYLNSHTDIFKGVGIQNVNVDSSGFLHVLLTDGTAYQSPNS
jgi:hypothetical protein